MSWGKVQKLNHYLHLYMKALTSFKYISALLLSAIVSLPSLAQDKEKKEDKKAGEAEMMAMMMEMAKLGDNHKLLQEGAGTWSYKVKWWMNPDAAPTESKGTSVARAVMGGRYVITDHSGKFQMPGADGKMTEMDFKGMATEGYDNPKKKFVSSWIDNMGTGIMNSEGTYDPATKTLTYTGEYTPMPGMTTKMRQLVKITNHDHRTMEFFEDRGGKEVKTMEINYTRKSVVSDAETVAPAAKTVAPAAKTKNAGATEYIP
jgi:hypothetical protein